MFIENIKSWKKITGIFALSGLVISVLAGILGGVSLPFLILRGILFAILFAFFSILGMKIIEQFIPELLEGSGTEKPERDEDDESLTKGSNVDVTIDDSEASYSDDALSDETDETGEIEEEIEEIEELTDEEDVEEIEELTDVEDEDIESLETYEELEELEEVESTESLVSNKKKKEDEVSALDMMQQEEEVGKIYKSSEDIEILGEAHSTEEIAKAVRTALKKDQEG